MTHIERQLASAVLFSFSFRPRNVKTAECERPWTLAQAVMTCS